jgi:hypothetical protein
MQITIKGGLTLAEIRQALYEKLHELEEDFAFSRWSHLAALSTRKSCATHTFGSNSDVYCAYINLKILTKFRPSVSLVEPYLSYILLGPL